MGILFNDPDVDLGDICWYNQLAYEMNEGLPLNKELFSIDEELNTCSCYVELHRNGLIDQEY